MAPSLPTQVLRHLRNKENKVSRDRMSSFLLVWATGNNTAECESQHGLNKSIFPRRPSQQESTHALAVASHPQTDG